MKLIQQIGVATFCVIMMCLSGAVISVLGVILSPFLACMIVWSDNKGVKK